jgi:hypothetical protein
LFNAIEVTSHHIQVEVGTELDESLSVQSILQTDVAHAEDLHREKFLCICYGHEASTADERELATACVSQAVSSRSIFNSPASGNCRLRLERFNRMPIDITSRACASFGRERACDPALDH